MKQPQPHREHVQAKRVPDKYVLERLALQRLEQEELEALWDENQELHQRQQELKRRQIQ